MASFDPDFPKLYNRIHSLVLQWSKREVSLAIPLVSLIQQYCTSEYTNARDKAYALLSLTTGPNGRDRLRFDYSLSIGEVYWDVIYFRLSLNHSIHSIALMTLGGFVEPDMDLQRPENLYLFHLEANHRRTRHTSWKCDHATTVLRCSKLHIRHLNYESGHW